MSGMHLVQDELVELVGRIREDIVTNVCKERPTEAQIALSRFAALMDQLSSSEIDKVRAQIRSILPALSAEKPNVAFAERAIVNIGNTLLKSRPAESLVYSTKSPTAQRSSPFISPSYARWRHFYAC
jgi:hypothetical protein